MLVREWLTQSRTVLAQSDSPKRDAEILLGFVLGKPRSWIIAFDDTRLTDAQLSVLAGLLQRRQAGEPVAHLLGEREFWSLPLKVNNSTLIPRPDTEVLVEVALELIPESPSPLLDLGTGTGAIALALGKERGIVRSPAWIVLRKPLRWRRRMRPCCRLPIAGFCKVTGLMP
ncbi:Release factor glutamine methyltransferase [Tatumella ptyseos]|uniref:Release factor glutamine methyltransferase n=1 Tax=Tatumella ptyseos TaxID=82987 RepID=A0A2X5SGT8_9GAMM|nr:Release factor glutamine methyltransferase [Tatumella ptyseos]